MDIRKDGLKVQVSEFVGIANNFGFKVVNLGV